MSGVTFPLARYDGGLKERPEPQRSGTFSISANHLWVLTLDARQINGTIRGALDCWNVEPTATGPQSCRVTVTSKSDGTVHFAFDLPDTSAGALMCELEAHAEYLRIAQQHQVEIQRLSDHDIFTALRTITWKLQSNCKDREERLAAWSEEIPLRKELARRKPVVIPPDILKATLSPYHIVVATAGLKPLMREWRSLKLQRDAAARVLAMQRASTPEGRDAANERLSPGARRLWMSMQPEYLGEFDPPALRADIDQARGDLTYAECLTRISEAAAQRK